MVIALILLFRGLIPKVIYLSNLIWMSNIGLIAITGMYVLYYIQFAQVNHDFCAVTSQSNS
jgi:hypothetical protein